MKAKIAALEKKVENNDAEKDKEEQVAQLAAALKESSKDVSSVTNTDDKNRSLARTILGITARKSE